jgi:signal peptidase I
VKAKETSTFTLEGRSMAPMLKAGDRLTVRWLDKIERQRLTPGSLVVAADSRALSNWVVHRLLHTFDTKGDASTVTDGTNPADLWGIVTNIEISNSRRSVPLSVTPLDRLIASASRLSMSDSRPMRVIYRGITYGLGLLRRITLFKLAD